MQKGPVLKACRKDWLRCDGIHAKGVLRWLHGHLRHRFQSHDFISPGDKVTWRFSSQPLYLQVSSRIGYYKDIKCWDWAWFWIECLVLLYTSLLLLIMRVLGLLPLFERDWVHLPPHPPSHLGAETVNVFIISGAWPSQLAPSLELLYHYMWEKELMLELSSHCLAYNEWPGCLLCPCLCK